MAAQEQKTTFKGTEAAFNVPPNVPDILIDGVEGALGINGVLRVNLVRFRLDPTQNSGIRDVVATLSMSKDTANAVLKALARILSTQGMLASDVELNAGPVPSDDADGEA